MGFLRFLFFLGIINIVFGFLWKWIISLPMAALVTLIRFDKGIWVVKAFGAYLLVSLTTIITLVAISDFDSLILKLFIVFVGGFVLFMGFAQNAYEAQKAAQENMFSSFDIYGNMQKAKQDAFFDALITYGSLAFYLVALFVPTLAANNLTKVLFDLIHWITDIPIIGWIIGLGGILFILSFIWQTFMILAVTGGSAFFRFKNQRKDEADKSETDLDNQFVARK